MTRGWKSLWIAMALLVASSVATPATTGSSRDVAIPGWLISTATVEKPDGQLLIYLLVGDPGEIQEDSEEAEITEAWKEGDGNDQTVVVIGNTGAESFARTSSNRSRKEFEWEPERPPRLYRLEPGHGELETVLEQVPLGVRTLEGENDQLFLIATGAIYRLVDTGAVKILDDPSLRPAGWMPRSGGTISRADAQQLWFANIGAFQRFVPGDEGDFWSPAESLSIRSRIEQNQSGLHLSSLKPLACTPAQGEPVFFASGPEALGKHRLRTEVYDLTPGQDARRQEIWSRYTTPEFLQQYFFLTLDSEPALVTWSRRADKMSLFAQPRFHLFRLKDDRTRAGKAAVLKVESLDEAGRWMLRPVARDVNGDGLDDIQFLFPDKKHFRVRTYLQSINGRYDNRVRVSDVSLKKARQLRASGFADEDLTGDGRPDLVVIAKQEILVYPGRAKAKDGRKLFENKASQTTSVGLESAPGQKVRILGSERTDLNGDGISEFIFTIWQAQTSSMALRIVSLN